MAFLEVDPPPMLPPVTNGIGGNSGILWGRLSGITEDLGTIDGPLSGFIVDFGIIDAILDSKADMAKWADNDIGSPGKPD